MLAQRMSNRQQRMLEVLRRLMLHTEALHQALRGSIGRHGKGQHLIQLQRFEGICQYCLGRLPRVTLTPMRPLQTPADFHRWGEGGLKIYLLQSQRTDQPRLLALFQLSLLKTM